MPYDPNKTPATLETISAKLDKLLSQVIAPEANIGPDVPTGRPATNVNEALDNAGRALDIYGVPHRWSGSHPGSLEDSGHWCVQNNMQWPLIDFSADQFGMPAYASWKDRRLAFVLLFQGDGIKSPAEQAALGFYGTAYDDKVRLYGWETMTLEDWFDQHTRTNGQGGASGKDVG